MNEAELEVDHEEVCIVIDEDDVLIDLAAL